MKEPYGKKKTTRVYIMQKEPKIELEELFSDEYEEYVRQSQRDNEAVHNVKRNTVSLNLSDDTQVSQEN